MKIKKVLSVILLTIFIQTYAVRPANAFVDPITPYIIGSVIFHIVAFGSVIIAKSSGTSAASGSTNGGNGSFGTQALLKYWAMDGPNGTPRVDSHEMIVEVVSSDVLNAVNSKPASFPNLLQQIVNNSSYTVPTTPGSVISGRDGATGSGSINFKITTTVYSYPPAYGQSPPTGYTAQVAYDHRSIIVWGPPVPQPDYVNPSTGVHYPQAPWYSQSCYNGSVVTDAASPVATVPVTPSNFATAVKSSPAALAEIPTVVPSIPNQTYRDTTDPSNLTAPVYTPPAAATQQQLQHADAAEYNAQLASAKQSRDNAQTVATNNPTSQNLSDAAKWDSAYQNLVSGGTAAMQSGYPVTSGSGTYPQYNGTSTTSSTVQPPTATSSGNVAPVQGGTNPSNPGIGNTPSKGTFNLPFMDSYKSAGTDDGSWADMKDAQSQFSFGGRLSKFFDDIKKTPIFSLPGNFLGNIPSGGSSTISFTAGRFGTHTYDFEKWGPLLTTLKVLILTIFSVVAVKIVALKGGGA